MIDRQKSLGCEICDWVLNVDPRAVILESVGTF